MSDESTDRKSLADKINDNRNLIMSLNQTVASMGLEKLGKTALGNAVTPATWVADYAVNENKPSLIDGAIWAVGAVGAAGAATVATSVGLWKAIVDDATHQQFVEALADEPPEYARHFILCEKTAGSPLPESQRKRLPVKGEPPGSTKMGFGSVPKTLKANPSMTISQTTLGCCIIRQLH